MMGKEHGHLTLVCDHPGQKGRSQKSWKGKKNCLDFFFAMLQYISPQEENVICNTWGAHSSESLGRGGLSGR